MRRLWISVVLCVLVLAGACGGGGGDGDGDKAGGDDDKLARAAVFVASDLPAGFAESREEEEAEDEEDPFDKCVGREGKELEEATTAEADSPDFEKGDTTIAGSASVVMKTDGDARKAMRLLGSEKLKTCFNDAFAEGVREGAAEEGGELPEFTTSVGELSFPAVGDEVVSYRGTVSFTVEGQEIQFPADFIFSRKGRTIGFYFFGNLGEPFPIDQEKAAITKALSRVD